MPRVDEILLEVSALEILLHAGDIDLPLAPQEIHHAAADAVHGKQAEGHAARMVVALRRLDEADRALLDEVESAVELRKRCRLLEDERLIRFDEPLARAFIAALLERGPKRLLLFKVQCLYLAELLQVICELHAAHLLSKQDDKTQKWTRASRPTMNFCDSFSSDRPKRSFMSYCTPKRCVSSPPICCVYLSMTLSVMYLPISTW